MIQLAIDVDAFEIILNLLLLKIWSQFGSDSGIKQIVILTKILNCTVKTVTHRSSNQCWS